MGLLQSHRTWLRAIIRCGRLGHRGPHLVGATVWRTGHRAETLTVLFMLAAETTRPGTRLLYFYNLVVNSSLCNCAGVGISGSLACYASHTY